MQRLLALLLCGTVIFGCQKFQKPELDTLISTHGDDESHNNGQNCMDCHYSEGWAEGVFTLAGTCTGNTNNATFILSMNPNGSNPILEVEVDQLGNAYTTEGIDFAGGLYTGVRSANGQLDMMEDPILHGQCNLCHGTALEGLINVE